MTAHPLRLALSLVALTAALGSRPAAADEVSKEACVDAHGRGQDAREQGKVSAARSLFLTCAQSQCPALVQDDCARLADELDRLQPWLNFAARDALGNDLPDTAVYVDEQLLLARLDEGKAQAVDPGRHVVRFSHAGRDESVAIVVGSGEKGRTVLATFAAQTAGNETALGGQAGSAATAPRPLRAQPARMLIIGGAALAATGITIGSAGLARVPSSCSLASHDCAAPPGDPAFDDAERAVRWSNAGWTLAALGAAALGAGLVWFFKSAKPDAGGTQLAPLVAPGGGGLHFSARL